MLLMETIYLKCQSNVFLFFLESSSCRSPLMRRGKRGWISEGMRTGIRWCLEQDKMFKTRLWMKVDFSKFLLWMRDPTKSSSWTGERMLLNTGELDLETVPKGEDRIVGRENEQPPLVPPIMYWRRETVLQMGVVRHVGVSFLKLKAQQL